MAKVEICCKEHSTYGGYAHPRTKCLICWKVYASKLRLKIKELRKKLSNG